MASAYRVFALRGLPPGLLGSQSMAIAAATEVGHLRYLVEYHVLTFRPQEAVISGTIDFDLTGLPPEHGEFDLQSALEEARTQIEIETANLLEKRALELKREDLAYLPFTYAPDAVSVVGTWMRGHFVEQIRGIAKATKCPKLSLYLSFVIQNAPSTFGA